MWRFTKTLQIILFPLQCVFVAIFVAQGYIERRPTCRSPHPHLCEEGSLATILHGTDNDSRVFLPAEFFGRPLFSNAFVWDIFLICSGCQLAEVPISSLLIWGKVPWQLFCKSCCVCVEHFLFQFVSRRYRDQLAELHIPPHLSGCLLNNYFANHAVCVDHFLFQDISLYIETNLQKCTSPPHLSGCLLNYFDNHAILCVCVCVCGTFCFSRI